MCYMMPACPREGTGRRAGRVPRTRALRLRPEGATRRRTARVRTWAAREPASSRTFPASKSTRRRRYLPRGSGSPASAGGRRVTAGMSRNLRCLRADVAKKKNRARPRHHSIATDNVPGMEWAGLHPAPKRHDAARTSGEKHRTVVTALCDAILSRESSRDRSAFVSASGSCVIGLPLHGPGEIVAPKGRRGNVRNTTSA